MRYLNQQEKDTLLDMQQKNDEEVERRSEIMNETNRVKVSMCGAKYGN
jgi:hypothetical protein